MKLPLAHDAKRLGRHSIDFHSKHWVTSGASPFQADLFELNAALLAENPLEAHRLRGDRCKPALPNFSGGLFQPLLGSTHVWRPSVGLSGRPSLLCPYGHFACHTSPSGIALRQ